MIALALTAALVLNPAVTQQTIHQTICTPGYSASYRHSHPVHLRTRRGFIRDHIISLELGGSSDPSNIQYQTKAEARSKDREERALNRAICRGTVSLPNAQARIEAWRP